MNKLNIVQSSNNIENVTTKIVDLLYNASLSVSPPLEGETDLAYVSGHISVDHVYAHEVEYLAGIIGVGNSGVVTEILHNSKGRFLDLRIDVTNGRYISFEDPYVKNICETTWGNGKAVTVLTLEEVTSLNDVFKNNTNITNFKEFKYFTGLNLNNAIKQLFRDCTNLSDIILPSTLQIVGFEMFYNCSSLNNINLENITAIHPLAFWKASLNEFDVNVPKLTNALGYRSFSNTLIKTVSNLGTITLIGESAFDGCSKLESITIPDTCTILGNYSFANIAITEATIPNNIIEIGVGIFEGCLNLITVNLPDTLNKISSYMFLGCKKLSNITLPQLCGTLGSGAFEGCTSLKLSTTDLLNIQVIEGNRDHFLFTPFNLNAAPNVITSSNLYLPNLIKLEFGAFKGLNAIQTVNLPSLTSLHIGAVFASCPNLTTVTSLGNITEFDYNDTYYGIRLGIFENCTSLTTVNLPSGLTELGSYMFSNCTALSNLNLPTSLLILNDGVFKKSDGLTNKVMYFPNVVNISAQMVFANRSNLHIYLPGQIQFKYKGAYGELKEGSVGEDWGIISWFAYPNQNTVPVGYCRMNTLYFKDISYFPAGMFYGAIIKTVIINNTTVPTLKATDTQNLLDRYGSTINDYIFWGYDSSVAGYNLDIYVPDSALLDYQNSPLFANVSTKIKALSTCPRITVAQAESGATGIIEAYMS